MPLHLPFNFPYFFGPGYRYPNIYKNIKSTPQTDIQTQQKKEDSTEKDRTFSEESSDYFFEILGLKLYYDDIIIISLLFFLYSEGVQDQELFICLILLLLS